MKDKREPHIGFYHASPGGPVPMSPARLESHLPLVRPAGGDERSGKLTYRVFFETIARVIVHRVDFFAGALPERVREDKAQIERIDVIAEKHGSDYHPARIRVVTAGDELSFVMNVAVTERGRERLEREFHLLRDLAEHFQPCFVPRAYFFGRESYPAQDGLQEVATMFLAEWFEGYHEFHVSSEREDVAQTTILWDMNQGYGHISLEEAKEIFRQAAFILTFYYDTENFREIFPWHHASGDFVVGRPRGKIDVKLITVRQYATRTMFEADSPENRMNALLLFFANLTVRMRLDRTDGVGEIAWAGDHCVEATIQGFYDAMRHKVARGRCHNSLPREFLGNVRCLTLGKMAETFRFAVDSYDEDAPDLPVIRKHLVDHVFKVYEILQDFSAVS